MTSTRAWAIAARYGRGLKTQCGVFLAIAVVAGCAAPPPPAAPAALSSRSCDVEGHPGAEVLTPHYRIRTTVRDAAVLSRFVRVMEAAYAQYVALVPPSAANGGPMEIVLFETPAEWDDYTRHLTGPDAAVYLSVGPGGYAYGDRFVCWLFNENDLWGVAAHEGFHQYVARHLPLKLPPALEEGLATTFETVAVTEQNVSIDRKSNARRQAGLVAATRAGVLRTPDELVRMHAGDVAGRDLAVREGFYGQCWALARAIESSPARADGLRRLLPDLRDGCAAPAVGRAGIGSLYYPAQVRPLLERYVAPDWDDFGLNLVAAETALSVDSGRAD